jgi:uncharacterized membrane protein YfcA
VAVIYSSAGFGGGSTYLSILAIMNLPYQAYPTLALICNLIVVTSSTVRFIKKNLVEWKKISSWIVLSIPMAFLGAKIHLPEKLFLILLASLLMFSGARIIFNNIESQKLKHSSHSYHPTILQRTFIGGILGLVSGIVGIGGGIFLSPIMNYWNMDKTKNIVIATTLFIFFNSLSSLIARFQSPEKFITALNYWPVLIIVFVGGQLGNRWCVYSATDKQLTLIAGSLSILASFSLVFKIFQT